MARPKDKGSTGKGKAPRARRARRGKGENMTGAQADKVEMRKAGELDLQQVVIEAKDFDLHYKAVKSARDKLDTANSLYRSTLKGAKTCGDDVHDAVKRALKMDGMNEAEIKRQMEIDGFILKHRASPIQLTIHDSLAGDVNQAAETAGYRDAKAGKVSSSPYPANSDLDKLYAKGRLRGTVENMNLPAEEAAKILARDDAGPFPFDHNESVEAAATIQ